MVNPSNRGIFNDTDEALSSHLEMLLLGPEAIDNVTQHSTFEGGYDRTAKRLGVLSGRLRPLSAGGVLADEARCWTSFAGTRATTATMPCGC